MVGNFDLTLVFVKSKISGAGADDIYRPNLWYFNDLLFLEDQETPRKIVSNIDPVYNDEDNVKNQVRKLLKYYYINLFIAKKNIQSIIPFVLFCVG
jgi:hypothetical protein